MKNFVKRFGIAFLVGFILIGFEFAYLISNREKYTIYYHYGIYYEDISKGSTNEKISEDIYQFITRAFPAKNNIFFEPILIDAKKKYSSSLFTGDNLLHNLPESTSSREIWAKYYYALAVEAAKEQDFAAARLLLVAANYITPYWSHFWIESGNYYQQMGEENIAQMIGRTCLNSPMMKDHCSHYFDTTGRFIKPQPIGFLYEEIFRQVN